MNRIVVVGSMNMDVVTHVKRHPRPGETIHGLGTMHNPGGKGANQAVAAARSGGSVQIFGALGNDAFATNIKISLSQDQIGVQYICDLDGATGTAFITVDATGENSIIVSPGANGLLDEFMFKKAVDAGLLDGCAALLVQNEIHPTVTRLALQKARALGIHTVFNPAPIDGVGPEWLELVDTVVVNETEAEKLTGVSPIGLEKQKLALASLLRYGAKEAILTLGDKGVCYTSKELAGADPIFLPSIRVNAVDTTAAGDTFVGAFVAARTLQKSVVEALWFGVAAAAITVTREGAQSAIPHKDESEVLLRTQ